MLAVLVSSEDPLPDAYTAAFPLVEGAMELCGGLFYKGNNPNYEGTALRT